MQRYIESVLLVMSGTVAIKLNDYLIRSQQNEMLSLVVAAVGALIVYEISKGLLIELPLRLAWVRPFLKPEARFEGFWISRVLNYPERPISFITIEYNVYSKDFIYSGTNFLPDGTIGASWKSTRVDIDIKNESMWFLYEAKIHDDNAETPQGFGAIDFEKDRSGKYTRARGVFIDAGTKFFKSNFFMDRLQPSDFQRLIGKKSAQTNEDLSRLVLAYQHERAK